MGDNVLVLLFYCLSISCPNRTIPWMELIVITAWNKKEMDRNLFDPFVPNGGSAVLLLLFFFHLDCSRGTCYGD